MRVLEQCTAEKINRNYHRSRGKITSHRPTFLVIEKACKIARIASIAGIVRIARTARIARIFYSSKYLVHLKKQSVAIIVQIYCFKNFSNCSLLVFQDSLEGKQGVSKQVTNSRPDGLEFANLFFYTLFSSLVNLENK